MRHFRLTNSLPAGSMRQKGARQINMPEKYRKPPLVEAVFEITFLPELVVDCQSDKYYDKIKKEFIYISLPHITSTDPILLKSYRFDNKDFTKIITYSINKFSFHEKKYDVFETFRQEAIKYIGMFVETYNIGNLQRTGLRYVNLIPINRKEGNISIEDYLNFGYKLPKGIPTDFELFNTILLSKYNDGKLRLAIQTGPSTVPAIVGEVITLDFDFFFEGNLSIEKLSYYLDESHKHIKESFESLISEEYKLVMGKGEG